MEYDERFLAPSFKGERRSVMFWGAVAHRFHSPLVAIRQRDAKERTHEKDKLGINSSQYCKEVLGEFLLPMLKEGSEVIEDGAPIHTSKETRSYRLQHGIHRIEWPANSPDLNLIENVWGLLKNKLRKQWRTSNKCPHTREELIISAQAAWDELPWNRIYKWFELYCIVLYLQPVLNPKSYDGARVL